MRKDVRMGFAVGGILLAVIIVAVLVIHRNHNAAKTVAFDPGNRAVEGGGEAAPTEGATKAPEGGAEPAAPVPLSASTTGQQAPAANAPEPHPAQDDATDKNGTRWDALFASPADDPLKAHLTSDAAKSKSHKTAQAPARHETPAASGGTEAVANSQIDSGAQPLTAARPNTMPPANSPAAVSSNSASRTHRVAAGETFVSIARMVYGDGRYYQAIADANPTLSPEKLKPGVVIQLPPESKVKQSSKSARPASPATSAGPALSSDGKTYTVQKDDSLYKIARKLYGKGEKSDELYELNKQVIGPDSTRLKIGMVLKLPEAVSSSASK